MKLYRHERARFDGTDVIFPHEATFQDIRAAAKELGFAVVPLDHIDDVLEDMEIEGMHDKSFYKKLQAMLAAAQED